MTTQKGLTLVEILISMALIILVSGGLYYFYSNNDSRSPVNSNESSERSLNVPATGFEDVDEMIVNEELEKIPDSLDDIRIEEDKKFDNSAGDEDTNAVTQAPSESELEDPVIISPAEEENINDPIVNKVDISMTAKQWEFIPNIIEVNEGDIVRLIISSIDVNHGIGIPQFKVSSKLSAGQTTVIEFIADSAGEYTFFCNVQCGVGHGRMRGTLIVH